MVSTWHLRGSSGGNVACSLADFLTGPADYLRGEELKEKGMRRCDQCSVELKVWEVLPLCATCVEHGTIQRVVLDARVRAGKRTLLSGIHSML